MRINCDLSIYGLGKLLLSIQSLREGNPGEFQLWSIQEAMDGIKRKGYAWAIAAGLNAAAAAIAAKFFSYPLVRYGLVVLFNVTMWGCYVQSLKALSSLQATVTNFATNFLSSGLAGFFLFQEMMSVQWLAGALLIVIGVIILSKSSIERKISID